MTAIPTMISFACSGCGRPFAVPASYAGRKATCKTCATKVVVPSLTPEPASAPLAAAPIAEAASPVEEVAVAATRSEGRSRRAHVQVVSEAQSSTLDEPAEADDASPLPEAEIPSDYAEIPEESEPEPQAAPARVPVRIRRLMADAEQMAAAFSGAGPIRIKSAVGDPPETYQVEYRVKGLQKGWFGRPKSRDNHLVEIQLTSEFPRVSPKCRMLTPVFHPNIDESTVCVTDHWTAGERLVDLVVRIGEMLAYQAYNIKSPLNGEAAMWADLNPKKLPVDSRSLHPGEGA